MSIVTRPPRFCGQCGAELPPGTPRFCIDCGHDLGQPGDEPEPEGAAAPPVTGATVRLPNAAGDQAVVGGTVRLPTAGAVPPGMWFVPEPPGPGDVVAVYVPLRAIVGAWSGLTSDGWRKRGQAWAQDGTSRDLVSFEVVREWFPAAGAGGGLRLKVRAGASSHAEEGRTRRGFRYAVGQDAPMDVLEAWWIDSATRRRRDLPAPQIQLMAPPRAHRVSDFSERIQRMPAREAEIWARQGQVEGVFRMPDGRQQRTTVGRGIPLFEMPGGGMLTALTGRLVQLYRVRLERPLVVRPNEWPAIAERIHSQARALGMDMQSDAVIEWWLEHHGYDGAVFEHGAHSEGLGRMVIAFRRSQIAAITR